VDLGGIGRRFCRWCRLGSSHVQQGCGDRELSVDDAVALFPRVMDVLTGAEWWRRSDGELADFVRLFARGESQCAAAGVAVLGEAQSRGLPAAVGAKDGAGWFRGLVPVTPRVARARAGLAEAFGPEAARNPDLAPTRVAFAAGDISVGHAGVIVRTVDAVEAIPDVDPQTRTEGQALLLATAGEVDPAQLGRAGLRLRHRLDPDAAARLAKDEDGQQERRDGYLVQESTGMWVLRGVLPPVAGAMVKAALDPLTAPCPPPTGPRTTGPVDAVRRRPARSGRDGPGRPRPGPLRPALPRRRPNQTDSSPPSSPPWPLGWSRKGPGPAWRGVWCRRSSRPGAGRVGGQPAHGGHVGV